MLPSENNMLVILLMQTDHSDEKKKPKTQLVPEKQKSRPTMNRLSPVPDMEGFKAVLRETGRKGRNPPPRAGRLTSDEGHRVSKRRLQSLTLEASLSLSLTMGLSTSDWDGDL